MRSPLQPRAEIFFYREKSQRESVANSITPTPRRRDSLPLLFLSCDPHQRHEVAVVKQLNAVALRSTRDKRATGKEKQNRKERIQTTQIFLSRFLPFVWETVLCR